MTPMLRALRHRDYRLYFSGQIVSLVGTWMQQIAMGWLAYRLSGSPLLLGLVGFAGQVPVLVLAPLGGAIADRVDRRRLLIAAQMVAASQAGVLAALTLAQLVESWHLVALSLVLGCVNAVEIPARQAYFVHIVAERADLPNAIALNSFAMNAARLVGPAAAGLVVSWVGEGVCFVINALSYVTVVLALLAIRTRTVARRGGALLADIGAGFRYAFGTPAVRSLLALVAVVSFAATPYTTLMPLYAKDVYGGTARTMGLLMACAGCGAVSGALYLAARQQVSGIERVIATAPMVAGAGLLVFSYSGSYWLAVPALLALGFGIIATIASCNTLIQSFVPDELRGRVMAIFTMSFLGIAPLGSLVGGALAEVVGAPPTLALGGVIVAVAGLVFRRLALPRSI